MKLIRKLSVGTDYKNAMHYSVGQEVYGGHKIESITEDAEGYEILIQKDDEVMPWKRFNKNMGISPEYNLDY